MYFLFKMVFLSLLFVFNIIVIFFSSNNHTKLINRIIFLKGKYRSQETSKQNKGEKTNANSKF